MRIYLTYNSTECEIKVVSVKIHKEGRMHDIIFITIILADAVESGGAKNVLFPVPGWGKNPTRSVGKTFC